MLNMISLEIIYLVTGMFVPFDHLPQLSHLSYSATTSLCFYQCFFFRFHIHMRSYRICLSLSWCISHRKMPSKSIHAVTYGRISFFLWLHDIPLCISMPHFPYPFIYWWTIGCFYVSAIVKLQWVRECRHLCETVSSFLSEVYPEVELSDHMVVLYSQAKEWDWTPILTTHK